MNRLILSLLIVLFTSSAFAQKIVGYIPNYRTTAWMDNHIEWAKMTDAFYFGARVGNGQGTVITIEEPARFQHVRTRASQNNLKIWLSIGGWQKSENYSTVAASASARVAFANKCVDLCKQYKLDGIDLDWEFPQSFDKTNYKFLLKEISDAFDADGSGYLLSVAAGAEQGHANNWDAGSFQYIDHVNIMAYDDPKLTDGNHSSLKFMKEAMEIYHRAGCPYEKMLGGVAFYNRCSAVQMYNQFANAQSYNPDTYQGRCYNGKKTCEDKLDYVMSKKGIGVLIWEVSQDVKGQYSLLNVLHTKAQTYTPCSIDKPNFSSNTISICGEDKVVLDPEVSQQAGVTYSWKKNGNVINGATSRTYAANSQGSYEFIATNTECSEKATVTVNGVISPVDLGDDQVICETENIEIGVEPVSGNVKWYKDSQLLSATTSKINVSDAGIYKIEVSATNCTTVSDEVMVTSNLITATDIQVCKNSSGTLKVNEIVSGTVNWYASASSTTVLQTGVEYEVAPTSTTTYFLALGSSGRSSCVGVDAWDSEKGYQPANATGDEIYVTFENKRYSLRPGVWWSKSNNPKISTNIWKEEGACGSASCVRTSVVATVDACLNTEEELSQEGFNVFPNPVRDVLFVKTNNNEVEALEVVSVQGEVLVVSKENQVNVSTLRAGSYVLKITTSQGVEYTKIIKE